MRARRTWIVLAVSAAAAVSPPAWVILGPTAGAHVVQMSTLPSGVEVHPVGEKVLGDGPGQLPINVAISPDGRTAVTSDSGPEKSLTVFDIPTRRTAQFIDMGTDALYNGLVWLDERRFFATGGPSGAIYRYDRGLDGTFARGATIQIGNYIASIAKVPAGDPTVNDTVAVDQGSNSLLFSITRRETESVPVGDHPQDAHFSGDGGKVYVSNWGAKTVSVVLRPVQNVYVPAGAEANAAGTTGDTRDYLGGNTTVGTVIDVGDHPSKLLVSPDGTRLYVTNGNDDTVSVIDTSSDRVVNTIDVAPYPGAPKSSAPQGLAITPDGRTLFVANGGNNSVAVVDTATAKVRGLIPAGWYPSSLALAGDDLVIVNAKGDGPLVGYDPGCTCYRGGADPNGSIYVVKLADIEAGLTQWTSDVMRYNRFDTRPGDITLPDDHPLKKVRKVVYVVRENKTYDQEFGDIPGADGRADLVRYGRDVTPNNHAMAERWGLLDNFYVNTETSIIGHQYSNAGQLSDYTQRTFGNTLLWSGSSQARPPDEGILEVSFPNSGYLVDNARRHGRSVRIYGLEGGRVGVSRESVDKDVHNVDFAFPPGFDNGSYPDTLRIREFIRDVKQNGLADFSYIWLPADHTSAGIPGQYGPLEQVASNDMATGMVLDFVSHSEWWKEFAMFVVEDDPQSGRDHVSPYRSIFMGASPWMKRGHHSSEHYTVPGVLRTIELALDLPAMSQNEHSAKPLTDLFTNDADFSTYQVLTAPVPPAFNPPVGEFAERSLKLNLAVVDQDEGEMMDLLEDMIVHRPTQTIPLEDRWGTTPHDKWMSVWNHDGPIADLMPAAAKPSAQMLTRIERARTRDEPPEVENEAAELHEWVEESHEERVEAATRAGVWAAVALLAAALILRARRRFL